MPLKLNTKPRKSNDEIVLPSGGYPYKGIPNGRIIVSAFDWNSERLMFDPEQGGTITRQHLRFAEVLKQIGTFPAGFEAWDVLAADALYMILKARSLSYGETYSFETICPECGHKETISLSIPEDMPVNRYPSDFTGLLEYETKDGNKVKVRFLTLKNEMDAENTVRNKLSVKKITKEAYDSEVDDQTLAAHVTEVNGEKVESSEDVLEWLKSSPLERDEIRSFIGQVGPGVSNKIPIVCEKCGHRYNRTMQMGPQFFRPVRRAEVKGIPAGVRLGVFGPNERREVTPGS